jgi:hypothetical protein
MWTKGEIEVTLNLGDLGEDIPATVKFNYSPSTPDIMYRRNGDPGEPGDPEEIELTELIVFGSKIEVSNLTEDAYERICDQISEMERD